METLTVNCHNAVCSNQWRIRVISDSTPLQQSGWWIVKCNRCNDVFDLYFENHLNSNLLISGATILKRLNAGSYSEAFVKQEVRKLRSVTPHLDNPT